MEKPASYCDFVAQLDIDNPHKRYHDKYYGFPIDSDNELFCRLALEINQAGLSWTTILKKEENFRKAFLGFDIKTVAAFSEKDEERLLSDKGIIRNKLKIKAVIYNANRILEIQKAFGSFKAWLDTNHPLALEKWIKLFKKNFKFTGKEITNEFLMSTGYIKGAHLDSCKIQKEILQSRPKWLQ